METWKKRGIVFSPEQIPGRINGLGADVEPLADGAWRLWYDTDDGSKKKLGFAEGIPGKPFRRVLATLTEGPAAQAELAIGNLPDGWNPRQPQHLQLQNGKHRLYFWTTAPGVVRYLAAESDDGKRYTVLTPNKACFYHPHDRAVLPNDIPDGLTPVGRAHTLAPELEPTAEAHLVTNDATTVYQLADGSFEAYTAVLERIPAGDPGLVPGDNANGYRRFITRFISADGLSWSKEITTLRPDANDPPDLQFYYLSVTHTPEGRIGLLGHYRCAAQTTDIEICFSKDGIHWRRPYRTPWLPRGITGDADHYAAIAARKLVRKDDMWWLFYTGHNFLHNHSYGDGPEASHLLLAQIESLPSFPTD